MPDSGVYIDTVIVCPIVFMSNDRKKSREDRPEDSTTVK